MERMLTQPQLPSSVPLLHNPSGTEICGTQDEVLVLGGWLGKRMWHSSPTPMPLGGFPDPRCPIDPALQLPSTRVCKGALLLLQGGI